jgi:argininosuccinate lyase
MTFRKAHQLVGDIILFAQDEKRELHQLTLDEMKRFTASIEHDVYEWLDPSSCIARRNIPGGTGAKAVKKALNDAKQELKKCRQKP